MGAGAGAPGAPMTPGGALPKPPQLPPSQTPAKPQVAELKKSPLRFLPFVLGALLILGIGYFVLSKIFGDSKPPQPTTSDTTPTTAGQGSTTTTANQAVTLSYWGLWEPSDVLQDVLDTYHQQHPNVTINYQMESYKDYKDRLQTAIASGRGPDIFRFHASWTPMLHNELDAMPTTVYSPTDFQNTFYPAATQQLSSGSQIFGIPLMYDGLALYYNSDALRAANAQPPKTWADVKSMASQLTIRSNGKIQRAGLAIGNTTNVEHFSDILALLILQNGGDPANPTTQEVQDAVIFYTNFAKVDKVWDDTLPSSTVAFARGDVAMMFAPSWRAHDVKALNPNLKFGIAPVPQLSGTKISWASFWAEGVSSQSKNKAESWAFLKYLSSADVERKLYAAASKDRAFGEIYSRKDLAADLANDPYVGPFLADAPSGQGWFLSSFTHDNGINDQMIKYYQDAVNAVLASSSDVKSAMNTVQLGVSQVLRQYNVVSKTTTSASATSTTPAAPTSPTTTTSTTGR
jgi:multiple sugar transport system substrate-binding protein